MHEGKRLLCAGISDLLRLIECFNLRVNRNHTCSSNTLDGRIQVPDNQAPTLDWFDIQGLEFSTTLNNIPLGVLLLLLRLIGHLSVQL